MQFSEMTFLFLFLPLCGLLFCLCPVKRRRVFLIAASLIFYGAAQPLSFLALLVLLSLIDYLIGLRLPEGKSGRTLLLILGLILHIGGLFCCKGGLFPLPVGLSFFTLQSVSYLLDIYTGRMEPERELTHLLSYLLFFPRLLAGPVERYADRNETLHITFSRELLSDGIGLFIRGLGKKVLLADRLAPAFALIQEIPETELSVITGWLGLLIFFLWIYFDFSGYCDMAVGLGKMFGVELPQNFNYPFLSQGIEDFLKRFHITLTNWFTLYVYLPVGRRCKTRWQTALCIVATWGLMGCWYGLSPTLILWGLALGLLICGEQFVWKRQTERAPVLLRQLGTLLLLGLLWVLFFSKDLPSAGAYYGALFGKNSIADSYTLPLLGAYGVLIVICLLGATGQVRRRITPLVTRFPRITRWCGRVFQAGLIFLCMAFLLTGEQLPFYFFRF